MSDFLLAHLSDPHLPPMPKPRIAELMGKRALGHINWSRNRHMFHRRDVLDLLVSDIQAQHPGHIALTGDLVNLALDAEFAPARTWLEGLGSAEAVSVVPGNHDAYVRATQHRFNEVFDDYLRGDDAQGDVAFPYVRRRGPLQLIGLSTSLPTAPFMATGKLGAAQLRALDELLAAPTPRPVFRVLMIHHPLYSRGRYKRLIDSAELLAILKRHGADLILHGHDHIHSTMWFDGPDAKIPAIGVPSASSVAHGRRPAAAYNLFAIARAGNGWRCEQRVRGIGTDGKIHEIKYAVLKG